MRVAIGSDHAGFTLKARLIRELEVLGHEVEDLGTFAAEALTEAILRAVRMTGSSGGLPGLAGALPS